MCLDDPTVFNRGVVSNLSVGIGSTGALPNAYAGVHAPDVVGNLRVDQAWGMFQISAAAHEVSGSYNILNTVAAPAGPARVAPAPPTASSAISGHPAASAAGPGTAA